MKKLLLYFTILWPCFVLAQAGALDPTFGNDGTVVTDLSESNDYARSVTLQEDGKIIIGGYTSDGIKDFFCLVRYNNDGTLDEEFGESGSVTTSFPSTSVGAIVQLQTDGKILLGGHTWDGAANAFALARYTTEGVLDDSFGNDGLVTASVDDKNVVARAMVIQPDGKIVLAGQAYVLTTDADDFALARFMPDGTIDLTFGNDGWQIHGFGAFTQDWANSLVIQGDNKLVAAGFSSSLVALARYTTTGELDDSFGEQGLAVYRVPNATQGNINDLALTPEGQLIAAISAIDTFSNFHLARFMPDGSIDSNFGNEGWIRNRLSAANDGTTSLHLQPDGKILSGGFALDNGQANFTLLRYLPNGNLDTEFGQNGVVTTLFESSSIIEDITQQPDGKIIAVGISSDFPYDITLARYLAGTITNSSDLQGNSEFHVYPNPANGQIWMNGIEIDNLAQLDIVGLDGRVWRSYSPQQLNLSNEQPMLFLQGLPASTYYLFANYKDGSKRRAILVVYNR